VPFLPNGRFSGLVPYVFEFKIAPAAIVIGWALETAAKELLHGDLPPLLMLTEWPAFLLALVVVQFLFDVMGFEPESFDIMDRLFQIKGLAGIPVISCALLLSGVCVLSTFWDLFQV
jgi:hypothetical protein